MANVKTLQTKKANLTEQLTKIETNVETVVLKLTEAHQIKIAELNTAFDAKVKAQRDGIVGKKERLSEELANVNAELKAEIGALQAQIDEIRGTTTVDVEVETEEVI